MNGRAAEPAAGACLQASQLLRRRICRHRDRGLGEEQTLLAVCHLLDALSRELVEHPDGLPEPVRRAAVRLAEQLDRADRAECGEHALPLPRQAPDRNVEVMGLR
ncbi:hypothetical protein [Pseudonocardia nigra]|uniref:hypothetical protein n=1 Tax=Pseudonocardia nigra TaxID=1921578 RepID=UPI001C5E39DE|nr:hypothetical protein [Pseudonocardia nigra]